MQIGPGPNSAGAPRIFSARLPTAQLRGSRSLAAVTKTEERRAPGVQPRTTKREIFNSGVKDADCGEACGTATTNLSLKKKKALVRAEGTRRCRVTCGAGMQIRRTTGALGTIQRNCPLCLSRGSRLQRRNLCRGDNSTETMTCIWEANEACRQARLLADMCRHPRGERAPTAAAGGLPVGHGPFEDDARAGRCRRGAVFSSACAATAATAPRSRLRKAPAPTRCGTTRARDTRRSGPRLPTAARGRFLRRRVSKGGQVGYHRCDNFPRLSRSRNDLSARELRLACVVEMVQRRPLVTGVEKKKIEGI